MSARIISLVEARRERNLPPARLIELDLPREALAPVRRGDAVQHIATGAIGFVKGIVRGTDGRILELQVALRVADLAPDVQGGAA